MSIRAIDTRYAGYRFRSRTEARWAVFFDALGVRWSYEPEGYRMGALGAYLPDFYVPDLAGGVFIEVKPDAYLPDAKEQRLWLSFSTEIGKPLIVLRGSPSAGPHIGTTPATTGATWTPYAFIVDLLTENRDVKLWRNPDAAATSSRAPMRAIEAARSARFEHGEAPVLPAVGRWTPATEEVTTLKTRIDRAIKERDEATASEAHARLLDILIGQWAPWRQYG